MSLPGIDEKDAAQIPQQTLKKFIKELLPSNVRMIPDSRNVIVGACVEFVHLVASTAQEQMTAANRKQMTSEHVLSALKELGFDGYIAAAEDASAKQKVAVEASRERKRSVKKNLTEAEKAELIEEQRRLFSAARSATGIKAVETSNTTTATATTNDDESSAMDIGGGATESDNTTTTASAVGGMSNENTTSAATAAVESGSAPPLAPVVTTSNGGDNGSGGTGDDGAVVAEPMDEDDEFD